MINKIKQFFTNNKKVAVITISSVLFFFILLIIFTYVININSPFINKIRSFFPMPAAIVGSSWITINELEENVSSVKKFYENQDFSEVGVRVDFETDDGKKRLEIHRREVLNKMIEDEVIKKIAKEYNIVISDELVQAEINRPLSEGGNREEIKKELQHFYGWDFEDFAEKVVRPQLLREKVEDRFIQNNPVTEDVKSKIYQAKKELDDGRDFTDVAKKYSEGSTKDKGGALGWFEADSDQLISEVNEVASSLELNKNSDIIESPLGLHIIRVNNSKTLDNGNRLIYVNQIFVKRKTFVDFVEEKMSETHISIPISGYAWDKDKYNVVFTSSEMQDFEKKIEEEKIKIN